MFQRQFQICLLVQIGPYNVSGPSGKLRFFKNNISPYRTVLKTLFHTGDLVTCTGDQGFLPLHGETGNSSWKIKWFVPFYLESVRKYRLSFEAIQFLYFFWSVQLIQIYFVVGYSSTRSTNNLILQENKHLKVFIHEIFNQMVSHANGMPPGELLCVLERWHTCYWLKHYLLQQDLKDCMATSHFISITVEQFRGRIP